MCWNQLTRLCVAADSDESIQLKRINFASLLPAVNSRTELGSTPLHFVALGSNLKLAKWLLENGASFSRNDDGETPLHWACKSGHLPMVQLFLFHMTVSDVIAKDYDALTPLDWAIEYEHDHIAKLLRSVIPSPPKDRKTSIFATKRK